MCELFAMSALLPTRVRFSFEIFARRGGDTADHRDGWGVALYDGADCYLMREPEPAAASPMALCFATHHVRSRLVLSHIRKATGEIPVALANTHPFTREVAGRRICFAHNGQFDGIRDDPAFPLGLDRPVGETDSEHAFCHLLREIRAAGGLDPARLKPHFDRLRGRGIANLLLADGERLLAYADNRMHLLLRHCPAAEEGAVRDLGGVTFGGFHGEQYVALIASVPLTEDEAWERLEPGTLVVLSKGRVVARE
ncbi:MAG: class II glutamine amidotransferase [Nitrospirae bacterium]|nr:MAG: class II glutamine amidotransferase [Nitrospirota bacterium]